MIMRIFFLAILFKTLCSAKTLKASLFITGISRLRGVVMYELQSTLSTYAKRKYSSGEISLEHLKNILKVSF